MKAIFEIPLILYYDNNEMKEHVTEKKQKAKSDNIGMFLKAKEISFADKYAKEWVGENVMVKEEFNLSISQEVINRYAVGEIKENEAIYRALIEIEHACNKGENIVIKAHKKKDMFEMVDGRKRWTYHYACFSDAFIRKLSRLFVSTIVYNTKKIKWPCDDSGKKINPEGFMVKFDLETHKAVITDISVYAPKEAIPFQIYINEVLDKIWDEIEEFDNEKELEEKAIDYYTDLKIDEDKNWGIWQPVSELDRALQEGLQAPFGVYMLYNSENKKFYVGKANEVYSRMDAHRTNKSATEPMPKFDYFRFSLVDKSHHKELFLIENAAIHDCAAIFNMPKAKTGHFNKISLQIPNDEVLAKNDKIENHVTSDLTGIIMTNTDEAQTKWNK